MPTNVNNRALAQLVLALRAHETDHLTDGQLLARFLGRRDEDAFAALVRRHAAMVLGVCRRVLGNAADADDAFQAVFLVLVRKARALKSRPVLGAWLHGVARRTALKAKAAAARRLAKEHAMARPEVQNDGGRDDWLPLLDQVLSELPQKYRLPIVLCELEGKTRGEAARQLGWPEGTVAGRLARGKALLAKRLVGRGVVLPAGGLAAALSPAGASACVPAVLLSKTIKAAGLIAAGELSAKTVIPAHVAYLMGEVMKAMLLSKLKNVAVVAAAIVVVGLGWLTYGSFGDEPGGTTAQAVADKAANTKAVKAPRARKEIAADAELTRVKLSEPMPAAHWDGKMTLAEVLRQLEKNHGFPKFAINNAAFTWNAPGGEGFVVGEIPIDVPNVPGISKARLLRLILDQVPTCDAAFLVRPNVIEITVNDVTKPEFQFVDGTFVDVPLEEVLAELSDRTGITILIDARAKEKAKTPITARFQHETNLATAVRLLADMADLKLVIVDRILYVTPPSNKADFPAGNLPGFRQKRADAAAA